MSGLAAAVRDIFRRRAEESLSAGHAGQESAVAPSNLLKGFLNGLAVSAVLPSNQNGRGADGLYTFLFHFHLKTPECL